MDTMAEPMQSLSVVPIFVNAGSVLLAGDHAGGQCAGAAGETEGTGSSGTERPGRTIVTLMLLGVGVWE